MAKVTGSLTVSCSDEDEAVAALSYFQMMVPEENEVAGVTRKGLTLTVPLVYPDWEPAKAMDHQEDVVEEG